MKLLLLILFFINVKFGGSQSSQYFGASGEEKLKSPLLDLLMAKGEKTVSVENFSLLGQKLFEEKLEDVVRLKLFFKNL